MTSPEAPFVHALWATSFGTIALAVSLSIFPKLGDGGRRLSAALCKAPLLDVVVGCFTIIPWILAGIFGGWAAFFGALVGQLAALGAWCAGHDLMHARAAGGPRIVKFHDRIIGAWNNEAALIVTLFAVPIFWGIRLMQISFGWALPTLCGFPKYKQSEWITVSRHKFDGLVGHDLVWCLYCDWMTGVWSLGSEVLRNVESFWCPIRYYDGKKCDNCAVDFPDINNGWLPADATMTEVVAKMEQMYGGGRREWFGHRARLTVNGQPLPERAAEPVATAQ